MPVDTTKLKLFLSYPRDQKCSARQLYHRLRKERFDVWFDQESLEPGQDWQREIEAAICTSHVFLACLSSSSTESDGFMREEIETALDLAEGQSNRRLTIIPTRLVECPMPERLEHLHAVDVFTDRGMKKLLKILWRRAIDRFLYP